MTLLHEAVDAKKLDVRVVERNVDRGLVGADVVKKTLGNLPDDADNAEYISVESLVDEDAGSSH